ncbi:hypothetical protein SPBR_03386 [Sporothrix brasiliensis 5110]|uniref:Uncharacterized protein n=1 Tax=Sporothrix brasiliensis 5110 TaxID=1398154 RepID=A0A0C2F2U5_9PEZI|nr:uncharacterized protein SPBR_03386 [Sporothrix brasiliensis 5110]KIH93199.1 hypothetical protein SPBR_03386 [Sporothrix brasiliensis 5110]
MGMGSGSRDGARIGRGPGGMSWQMQDGHCPVTEPQSEERRVSTRPRTSCAVFVRFSVWAKQPFVVIAAVGG